MRMDRERPIAQTVCPIRAALVEGTGFPVCPNCEGGSPFPGEDSAAAAAGTFAVSTAGDKKGRHLRFLPSLNTRFPCGVAWVQMVDCVSVEKGNGRGFFSSAWYNIVSHFGCRTATQTVKLTQARHDSAAQRFYLCRLSKSCGCSQFAPENGLHGTVILQSTLSCPSGNSPCAAPCVE